MKGDWKDNHWINIFCKMLSLCIKKMDHIKIKIYLFSSDSHFKVII